MAGGSILIAGIFMQPWITYMALAAAYAASIPVSAMHHHRRRSGS